MGERSWVFRRHGISLNPGIFRVAMTMMDYGRELFFFSVGVHRMAGCLYWSEVYGTSLDLTLLYIQWKILMLRKILRPSLS